LLVAFVRQVLSKLSFMTRRRWIADEVSGNQAALTGAHAEHLARVLRARVGQEFDIVTRAGVRRGRVTSVDRDRVEFDLREGIRLTTTPCVTLVLSIFKFDRMEWAIEKCTELGAARIIPLFAGRTEAHLATAAAKRVQRWQRIARQASEQARRDSPPEICPPCTLKQAVAWPGSLRILLAKTEPGVRLRDVLQGHSPSGEVVLALGPEGGWTERELELFRDAGWISASLANTVLRSETAAMAAMAIVLSGLR
jgi:16S rRNA (uracil1498-N3)-methyltransferase